MRVAIAVHGTRGDVEPAAALARELGGRGHRVDLAVPPNLIGFVDSLGLGPAQPYGVASDSQLEDPAFRRWWSARSPVAAVREAGQYLAQGWSQMGAVLGAMAADADVIVTGTTYQEIAANVAERHRLPLVALHFFPMRLNSHVIPHTGRIPLSLLRPAWAGAEWAHWRLQRSVDAEQRAALRLPATRVRAARRVADLALEIQAYDEVLFPGLSSDLGPHRPFSGALSLQRGGADDDAAIDWIRSGKPPVFVSFGSMPMGSDQATVTMIVEECLALGERVVLSGGGQSDTEGHRHDPDRVLHIGDVSHALVMPECCLIVHHGGLGTLSAALRARVPSLVLWVGADQPVWARRTRVLDVGMARRFSSVDRRWVNHALRTLREPSFTRRAAAVGVSMSTAGDAAARAADLVVHHAASGRR